MKKYRLMYEDGRVVIVEAKNACELVKKYDLCTKENIHTIITQLSVSK